MHDFNACISPVRKKQTCHDPASLLLDYCNKQVIFFVCHSSFSGFGQCEEGWRPYEERCYYFSSDMKSWHDALEDCVSKGGNLMSIQDLHERVRRLNVNFTSCRRENKHLSCLCSVQTWVHTQIGTSIYWIGLNDVASEGNWEWSDGSVYYPYLS